MSIKAKIINGLCLFNIQSFGGLESFFRYTNHRRFTNPLSVGINSS